MLSLTEAQSEIKKTFHGSKILNYADMSSRFVFQVTLNQPGEEQFPVLIAVDKIFKKLTDISIFDDPDRAEIARQLMRKE